MGVGPAQPAVDETGVEIRRRIIRVAAGIGFASVAAVVSADVAAKSARYMPVGRKSLERQKTTRRSSQATAAYAA